MHFYHIGYFPKRLVTRTLWPSIRPDHETYAFPAPAHVQQICAVSSCIVDEIESFDYKEISENNFNQYGGFNSPEDARAVMARNATHPYELYAYALPETIYQDGIAVPYEIGCIEPEAWESEEPKYKKMGYDIVEVQHCSFLCSPLSCNHQAFRNPNLINQNGLAELESDAIWLAEKFSIEKPEPGPYIIVELRRYEP